MPNIKQITALYKTKFAELNFDKSPRGLYEPMQHIISVPGKHIRPLLLLLGTEAFGGNIEEALPAAHAMELFHSFTLLHDDIMDKATLRRGIQTVHQKYGLNSGILVGDALFPIAYTYLCSIPAQYLVAVLDIFNRSSIGIIEGQQVDIDFEQQLYVTVNDYIKMIGDKTSVLLACSLQIGAIIGGASKEDQQCLYEFGMKIGLSFQIKDDWLDTFGESIKVGKKAGGDILQNKKTYLLITLLADTDDTDREKLITLLQEINEERKVSGVKNLYEKYNVSTKTLEKIEALYQESIAALKALSIPESDKANLYAMAEMIHHRDF